MNQIRALVVDDSLTIRAMIEQILSADPGIDVVGSAADAKEAWLLINSCQPDVMTLDVNMPGLDGLRFLSDVMARMPIPVVMLSSVTGAGNEERAEAIRRGAAACFDKAKIMTQTKEFVNIIKVIGRPKRRRAVN